MCEVLEVSRSGFYAWQSRPESQRSRHHRELVQEIRAIHSDRNLKSYGSPRVHQELVARGKKCSENTVAKLMHDNGLAAQTRKKYRATTDSSHSLPISENVLNREFQQDSPDRVWLADITYIWTLEGWLYLAAVLDVYSRKIVGWSMSHRLQSNLVLDALRMALGRRCPDQAADLLHHSDRGSQYASQAFQKLLRDHNITCSMSRKGELLGQRDDGELFRNVKERMRSSGMVRDTGSCSAKRVLNTSSCFTIPDVAIQRWATSARRSTRWRRKRTQWKKTTNFAHENSARGQSYAGMSNGTQSGDALRRLARAFWGLAGRFPRAKSSCSNEQQLLNLEPRPPKLGNSENDSKQFGTSTADASCHRH